MSSAPEFSIVKILNKNGHVVGAGTLIGKKWVLTCRHVVEKLPHDEIYLTFYLDESEKYLKSHLFFLAREGELDIAILELEDGVPPCAIIGKLTITKDFWDRELKIMGFSSGTEAVSVSVVGMGRADANHFQIDVKSITGQKIDHGFSGAPVFDTKLSEIVGIVEYKVMNTLSGGFTPIDSILSVCKRNSVDIRIFESLYDLYPPNSPQVNIAKLIATSLQRLPDKERINEIIQDIVEKHDINIPPWLRDGELCFYLAKAMLNLNLDEALQILNDFEDYNLSPKEIESIFTLLIPFWVDSETATCVSERALHKDNKKAIALNANEHFSAKMCVNRASGRPPGKWPTYSCSGKYGINAADEIVKEIEYLFRTDLLKSGYLKEDMNPHEQRAKLKMLLQYYKNKGKPTFFILNYSKDIMDLLIYAQEVYPCVILFLLTGDAYPQPSEFGKLDCACLLNLGLNAEKQIFDEIRCACQYLGIPNLIE